MSMNYIKEQIIQTLEAIIEQTETINNYESKIPQIELDIIMSNVRKLYENLNRLDKINQKQETVFNKKKLSNKLSSELKKEKAPEIEVEVETNEKENIETYVTDPLPIEEIRIMEKKEIRIEQEKPVKVAKPVMESKIDIEDKRRTEKIFNEERLMKKNLIIIPQTEQKNDKAEKEPEKEKLIPEQKIVIENQNNPEKIPNQVKTLFSEENILIGETFKGNGKSINDRMAQKEDRSISAKLQRNPISNLKTAIGINEKFLLMNELFNGNMNDYTEAMNALNNFESYTDATNFINNLEEKYNWDESIESIDLLIDFIQRRYLR